MIVIGLNIKKSINFDLNFIRNFSVNNLTSSLITTGETGRIPSTTHQFHNYYLLKQSLIVYFIKYIILIYAVANSASSPCPFKAFSPWSPSVHLEQFVIFLTFMKYLKNIYLSNFLPRKCSKAKRCLMARGPSIPYADKCYQLMRLADGTSHRHEVPFQPLSLQGSN